MPKECILEARECMDCGECLKCDLNPEKICDDCCSCIDHADYRSVYLDDILTLVEKKDKI